MGSWAGPRPLGTTGTVVIVGRASIRSMEVLLDAHEDHTRAKAQPHTGHDIAPGFRNRAEEAAGPQRACDRRRTRHVEGLVGPGPQAPRGCGRARRRHLGTRHFPQLIGSHHDPEAAVAVDCGPRHTCRWADTLPTAVPVNRGGETSRRNRTEHDEGWPAREALRRRATQSARPIAGLRCWRAGVPVLGCAFRRSR